MITISPGHWHVGTGAVGIIDEVKEARNVVNGIVYGLRKRGVTVHTVVDTRSKNQRENLVYLVRAHNATQRQLDVSVHFNAFAGNTKQPVGTEVLYKHDRPFAEKLSRAIATAGHLKNRGAKYRDNLAFLNGVGRRAVLLEICFVNSEADVACYRKYFRAICEAIAEVLAREVT